jgi:AraC-like DNA-binding protein
MTQPFTIAASIVNRFYHGLIDLGVSQEEILTQADIKKADLTNPDDRIPVEKYARLTKMAPVMTSRPEVGLILGQRAEFKTIGILFEAAISCNTLGEGLLHTVKFSPLGTEACEIGLDESGPYAEWSLHYLYPVYFCPSVIEFDSCQNLKILKSILGEDFKPVQMKFQHPPPEYLDHYQQIFQVPLLFEQEKCAIVFEKAYLATPNPNPQPYVKELLIGHAERLCLKNQQKKTFQDRVSEMIIKHLGSGSVSLEAVAQEMSLSRRSVARNLQKEDTSYKVLLNEIQKHLSTTYLEDVSYSISEIASLLGFSEVSAFYRAFKRWFGTNPGQYRRHSI